MFTSSRTSLERTLCAGPVHQRNHDDDDNDEDEEEEEEPPC